MKSVRIDPTVNSRYGKWRVISNSSIRRGHSTLWECECDCGTKRFITSWALRANRSAQCKKCQLKELRSNEGAKEKKRQNSANRNKDGLAAFNVVLVTYKSNAVKRNHIFDLTVAQFKDITSKNCHYCDSKPSTVGYSYNKEHTPYVYNGIDRKDNKLGYTLANSLPCCTDCNLSKLGRTYDEYIRWIKRSAKNLEGKNV